MTWISYAMPRSASSVPAFSIVARSDSDPITIPTSGASSPEANSDASTSVCVSGCVTLCLLHRAQRDVRSHLLAVELHLLGRGVCTPAGLCNCLPKSRHVQDAAARGHQLVAAHLRPGVQHLGV